MNKLTDVAPAFVEMAHSIVWCSAATVDAQGRPRSRILHPIWQWDGTFLVGWVGTSPTPIKQAHLKVSPYMSLNYWTPSHDTCAAEHDTDHAPREVCAEDAEQQRRVAGLRVTDLVRDDAAQRVGVQDVDEPVGHDQVARPRQRADQRGVHHPVARVESEDRGRRQPGQRAALQGQPHRLIASTAQATGPLL